MIDQLELERVAIDAVGSEPEHALLLEHERHAAGRAHVAAVVLERVADVGDGARHVVGRGLDHHRDAVRAVAFIDHDVVVGGALAAGLGDRGRDPIFRHVDGACVLERAAQRRVAVGAGPPALTAIAMSLPIFVNCFATRSIRAKIVCLRFSNARPMRATLQLDGAVG